MNFLSSDSTTTTQDATSTPVVSIDLSGATALRISASAEINTAATARFTAPTWQNLSDLWDLRRKKLLAIEDAVRILERDPSAADLPDCEAEIAIGCIARRGPPLVPVTAGQPGPMLAHAPQIVRSEAR